MSAKVRLYVDHPLGAGQAVPLERAQAHYLGGVMRLGAGDRVSVFNGRDGEWLAEIVEAGKRGGRLVALERTGAQSAPPDLWLLFAPLKKARTDFVVEKAVELGVARLLPVTSAFTNAERVRQDRLQAHAIEAAEQCGATFVPEVAEVQRLDRVLAGWDAARRLIFCDEAGAQEDFHASGGDIFGKRKEPGAPEAPAAILIGPEGGFSQEERDRLSACEFVARARLGPRILRAETAAVAALTLWQHRFGDWS